MTSAFAQESKIVLSPFAVTFEAAERGQTLMLVGYLLMGAAVFLLVRMLVQEQESRAAQDNIDRRDRASAAGLLGLVRMLASQYVVPFVRGRPIWEKQRTEWRRRLISAGLREELTPDEFIAFRLLNILLFPVVTWVLNVFGLLDIPTWATLALGGVGYAFPALWVDSKRKARQKEILKSMPFVIDLLALATEAGADFMGAIGKVVDKAKPSPLVQELEQMLRENRLGASQRDSIREMAARIDLTEFSSFAAILISSQEMGASIGRILRQQSEQIRLDRIMRAEKAGAAASQMVLVPVVLFVLPAVVLMMGGPFILGFINGGGL